MADFTTNPNLDTPLFSVVILMYHRTPDLVEMAKECVQSVKDCGSNQEIIIVDNGSTFKHAWDKECDTLIRFNKNWGISRGWNAGIKAARGKYIVVIGDDTVVAPGWLEAMQKGMEQPNAGTCNPAIEHLGRGTGIETTYKWPSGAWFMLSRETIAKVGYFAEDVYYPANFEDVDYWTRIYKAGLKIYKNYDVEIQHREGQTVHSPDIHSRFEAMKRLFIGQHGFDPIPVFFGDGLMPV